MTPLTPEELKICQALNLIRFYPRENHDLILEDIARFAAPEHRAERLSWLVSAARAAMKEAGWRDDLRGLWCTRFPPADGIEADCSLAGHTPADIESEHLRPHAALAPAERKALAAAKPETLEGLHGLLSAARVKKLEPEENYQPPDWLKNS